MQNASTLTLFDKFTPFSLGFDDTFNKLAQLERSSSNYPPYNIVRGHNGRTILEVALAGFSKDDIEVTTEENTLTVSTRPDFSKNCEHVADDDRKYIHKGIASRIFTRTWEISEKLKVESIRFEDGLLKVVLQKVLAEHEMKKVWFGYDHDGSPSPTKMVGGKKEEKKPENKFSGYNMD
tara:strand:+ start:1250 stop:1786 length:537 start_codon:yes stop_codon:yes gene_type:complete